MNRRRTDNNLENGSMGTAHTTVNSRNKSLGTHRLRNI